MAEPTVSQEHATFLLQLEKSRVDDREWEFPQLGGSLCIPLKNTEYRESFHLDISRHKIDLSRGKFQNRARQNVVLVRLDMSGPVHTNPDDTTVPCPHLHLYKAGFDDRWAYPIPEETFGDLENIIVTLQSFMRYCNIVQPPYISGGIFV